MTHQHTFIESDKEGYMVCSDCGTYKSFLLKPPDEIYHNYWGDGTGRSTLDQQVSNMIVNDDCGVSKIERVLQFVPKRGKNFLEVGCAPGELMRQMLDRNYSVWGIEPSPEYIPFITNHAQGANVVCGYFPKVTRESNDNIFDCIASLDTMEHIPDYQAFFKEVHRLLIPGGTAIIMSPIILNRDGLVKKTDFLPFEHSHIFTEKYLDEYLKEIFSEVKFTRWLVGHEMIILKK